MADFSAHCFEEFSVETESGKLSLQLMEVEDLRRAGVDYTAQKRREPFSLLFEGPESPFLSQKIYPFQHETMGSFELFIVPIGKNENKVQYQVIFN